MLFKSYDVTLTLTEPMLGTVPKNANVYADYIASKAAPLVGVSSGRATEDGRKVTDDEADALADEETSTVPIDENRGWTGFHTDPDGIFIYDYQVKGFIKEAANVLKEVLDNPNPAATKLKGILGLRSKIDSYLFVFPRRIRLGAGPEAQPFERPLRAMTAQGPRVTLVRSDVVAPGTVIKFTIKLLPHKELNFALLKALFEYGEFQGLGQFRNGSFGRFEFDIKETPSA